MDLEFQDPHGDDDVSSYVSMFLGTCGLCRFEFSEGEKIYSISPYKKHAIPKSVKYESSKTYGMTYHRECFFAVGDQSWHDVFAATFPGLDFEGYHHLEHRRYRWLKDTFAQDFFHIVCGRLPLEVCRNIAVYCVRERAIQAFQQHCSQDNPIQPRNISVPVHPGVKLWAQYVHYEGDRYVRSFSYDSRGGHEDVVLDWSTEKLPNVFVRHNGLGVNEVIITDGNEAPNVEHVEGFYLKAKFDGIKLRGLTLVKSPDSFIEFNEDGPCEIRWAVPPAPVKHSPKIPLPNGLPNRFVRAVDWNKPGTLGYSFLVSGSVIHHIKSHQAGTPAPPEEYERLEVDPVTRLYLHMSPGEIVSELWVRTYRGTLSTLSTLIVITDYGRSLVVGPQANIPGVTYHAIAKLPKNKPSRMFYLEAFDERIGWLHFDSVSTWRHPDKRQIQSTWGREPERPTQVSPRSPAYYTSARLDGVREVTSCMARPLWYWGQGEKITGLLFSYANGSRSSVGEVRLDKLGTPMAVTSDTMFIQVKDYGSSRVPELASCFVEYGIEGFGFSEPLSPISSDETVDNADDEADDDSEAEDGSSEDDFYSTPVERTVSIAVPMSGRLDWTKTESTDDYTLSHHKNSTPRDEMRHVLTEHGAMPIQEPVVRSLTTLIGNIGPENLEKAYQNAEANGNYDIFGL